MKQLEGKKTYVAAGILALVGLYQIYFNGAVDVVAIETIAMALGLAGLRAAKK